MLLVRKFTQSLFRVVLTNQHSFFLFMCLGWWSFGEGSIEGHRLGLHSWWESCASQVRHASCLHSREKVQFSPVPLELVMIKVKSPWTLNSRWVSAEDICIDIFDKTSCWLHWSLRNHCALYYSGDLDNQCKLCNDTILLHTSNGWLLLQELRTTFLPSWR